MGVDYLERQARNRDIGLKGELLVVEHERCGCRKSHPCRLSGMSVLVEDAAEAVRLWTWSRVAASGSGIGEGNARSGRAFAIPW